MNQTSDPSSPDGATHSRKTTGGGLRIGTRLALSFAIVLALLSASLYMGIRGLNGMYTTARTAVTENVQLAQHASNINVLVLNERRFEKDMFINVADPAKVSSYKEKWDGARASMAKEIQATRQMTLSTEDKDAIDKIAEQQDTYAQGVEALVGRLGTSLHTTQEANAAMGDLKTAVHSLEDGSQALNERAISGVNGIAEMLATTRQTTQSRLLLLAGCCLALCIAFCILITRSITGPLRRAVDVSKSIAGGRLDNDIPVASRDETGELLVSLRAMQESLLEAELNAKGQLAMIGQMQAVAEYTPDGSLLEANENFLRILGSRIDAIRGKPHSQFVDSVTGGSQEYRQFWGRLGQGKAEVGEFRRIDAAGNEIWMQGMYSPILDASGKPFKVVSYLTDVTSQRRAAALNAAFKGALEKLHSSVMVADNDGRIIYLNASAGHLMRSSQEDFGRDLPGFDAATLIGQPYETFHRKPSAQHKPLSAIASTHESELVLGGRSLRLTAHPMLDDTGRRLGTAIEWVDLTQEIATQQELKGVIDSVTRGELGGRIALQGKTGFFEALSLGINSLVDSIDTVVQEVQTLVTAANDGNLARRMSVEDKTGLLVKIGSGINQLIGNMATLVAQVKETAQEVHRGADEISQGNTNLSQRTEEQASSLEETASSMEEMTSTVKQNADNAGQANQLAMAARDQAEKGGTVVAAAVRAMTDINDSSKKIADIIGVIDEIAFQTNLLALNAAVEAARAGEQGRGFAVVATEVRNLAGRSATAAKEIKGLIQDSVMKVDQGSLLVNESGATLEQIVSAVKKVTDIVAEIAAASQEQSSGIEQVNKAVMQLDELTQQNAALVEEASAASQSMADQARALNDTLAKYQVQDGAPAAPSRQLRSTERRGSTRPWAAAAS